MATTYPFEHIRAQPQELAIFKKALPSVTTAIPEFFRTMDIANKSIEQKNMFGNPLGIRQDLGFENALKVLLIACFNDGLLTDGDSAIKAIDVFRTLTLKWYAFGNKLDSCLYFGYFAYSCHAHAIALFNGYLKQSEFLAGGAKSRLNSPDIANLLVPTYSTAWYKTASAMGDKLQPILIADSDVTKTGLPRPGYQVHFRNTNQFDLRAPTFIEMDQVETPVIRDAKVIVSCPTCRQKCRGNLFKQIEVTCPSCKTTWKQFTS
jgi:hypothetical protein